MLNIMNNIYKDDNELLKIVNSDINNSNLSKLRDKVLDYKLNIKPMPIKICLHPCSGKTYFVRKNGIRYDNIFLYDFDYYRFSDMRRRRNIFNMIQINKHSCLLGCYEDTDENDNIIDISVIILYSKLIENYKSRLLTNHTGWTNLNNILDSRNKLIKNSINNNLPIFISIRDALDFIIKIYCLKEGIS